MSQVDVPTEVQIYTHRLTLTLPNQLLGSETAEQVPNIEQVPNTEHPPHTSLIQGLSLPPVWGSAPSSGEPRQEQAFSAPLFPLPP